MKQALSKIIATLGFTLATGGAQAASVDFIEAAIETDPVTVLTDIVLAVPIVTTPETAVVSGLHHPGISPEPLVPGKRAAALFEPGPPGFVSDWVQITIGDVRGDSGFGVVQDLFIEFFSADIALGDLLTLLDAGGFSFGGGVVEDGTLQDLSGLLGTLPEGLIVRALSRPGEAVPEPASMVLIALAAAALGAARRRKKLH